MAPTPVLELEHELTDPVLVLRQADYPIPVLGHCTCKGYPHTLSCPRVVRVVGAPIQL